MTYISYENNQYELTEGETVLDCLLRHGVTYPHSCKTGNCQSCLCQSKDDFVESDWQKGLRPTLASQGYFLPCIARPKINLSLLKPSENLISTQAKIVDFFYFNFNVLCLRVEIENAKDWKGGQYINLITPTQIIRSYSIANLPDQDGYIELHIKIISNGLMGNWLTHHAKIGDFVHIRGPIGNCFYCNPNHESFPILLAGTSTGLAPLLGIAQDALAHNHPDKIILIHGGVKSDDLYLDSMLTALSEKNKNFIYLKSILEKSDEYESIDKIMIKSLSELTKPTVYVCGPSDTTNMLKTKAFLTGVPSKNIYSDAYNC